MNMRASQDKLELGVLSSQIDESLKEYLPDLTEEPSILHESMRYSVFAGGKRIRPILCLKTCELINKKFFDQTFAPACSLELIHTYSLIHDDLPAMDNDDLRRGKATNHKIYGEDIAILSGDALLTLAFQLISEEVKNKDKALRIITVLSKAIGSIGMIGGQVLDVKGEGKSNPTKEDVIKIHQKKTGALLQSSMVIGAIMAEASEEQIGQIEKIGLLLGQAFQIVDDILDVESNHEELGKSVKKDEGVLKITYPRVFGLEESKLLAKKIVIDIKEKLDFFGPSSSFLKQLADFVISRSN